MDPVDLLDPSPAGFEAVRLSRAVVVIARGRAQSGDFEGALRLLVQGAAVIRDLRRGPVTLVIAMMSAGGEQAVWAAFQNILNQTERLDARFAEQLTGALDALSASPPPLHAIFLFETMQAHAQGMLLASQHGEMRDHGRMTQWISARLLDELEEWCPEGEPRLDCVPPISTVDEWPELTETILGKRAVRGVTGQQGSADWHRSMRGYPTKLFMNELLIRIAKLTVHLVEERAHGRCPPLASVPPALLLCPGSTAPLEVSRLRGYEYEIIASPPSTDPTGSRLAMMFICPGPPSGHWVRDPGTIVEPPGSD